VRVVGDCRQPLATPAAEVGHDDLAFVNEVDLGLVDDPPAARAAAAARVWADELGAEIGRRDPVARPRSRLRVKLPVDDVAVQAFR
jgi:hypothetical protein